MAGVMGMVGVMPMVAVVAVMLMVKMGMAHGFALTMYL
jgi:hypothetical protein